MSFREPEEFRLGRDEDLSGYVRVVRPVPVTSSELDGIIEVYVEVFFGEDFQPVDTRIDEVCDDGVWPADVDDVALTSDEIGKAQDNAEVR